MSDNDVTERAARIINEVNWKADFKGGARADEIAQALADAGLLNDSREVQRKALKASRLAYDAVREAIDDLESDLDVIEQAGGAS